MSEPILVLASQSRARQEMLNAAGISFVAAIPKVDEDALKENLINDGATPRDLARGLAEAKAMGVSGYGDNQMILGGDQVLALENGELLNKPLGKDAAKVQLLKMSDKTHKLYSAAVMTCGGSLVWSHVEVATMSVRRLSEAFVDQYVDAQWDHIRHCVGCYEIEGQGVQLFNKINGNQFTIMGLPLLPLLEFLRMQRVIPS